jgi:hypothetical protein
MKRKLIAVGTLIVLLGVVFAPTALAHDGVGGDEYAAADIMLMAALLTFVAAAFAMMYAISNGEFKNPEETKRRMLELATIDEDGNDVEMYVSTEEQYFEDVLFPNLTKDYAPANGTGIAASSTQEAEVLVSSRS